MQTTPRLPSPPPRDAYGALRLSVALEAEYRAQAAEVQAAAIKSGLLPAPYIKGNRKEYESLNLDVYDVLIARKKVKALVVQCRTFWKHVRKGYTRTEKRYYLVVKSGRTVHVTAVDQATCVKRAKNTAALGQLVEHYLGKSIVKCKPPTPAAFLAYKVLARSHSGGLESVFDSSEYTVGKWRTQAAQPNHGGGFYFYFDEELAIRATASGSTFGARVAEGKELVLCEVEVQGRQIPYDGGKWAASKLRVLREIGPAPVPGL